MSRKKQTVRTRHTAMGKQLQVKSSEQRRASILCQTRFLCDMYTSVWYIYKSVSDMYMYASLGPKHASPRAIQVSLIHTHVSNVHNIICLGHKHVSLIQIPVFLERIHVSRGHKNMSLRHIHVSLRHTHDALLITTISLRIAKLVWCVPARTCGSN